MFHVLIEGRFDNEFFQQSESSSNFRQEYEMRKMKQASHIYRVVFVYTGDFFLKNVNCMLAS